MTDLQPTYYLVHGTPDGPRYAYPAPAVPDGRTWPTDAVTWSAFAGDAEVPVAVSPPPNRHSYGRQPEQPGWIITGQPVNTLVASWTTANPERGPWRKRDELPSWATDPMIVATYTDAADEPTAEVLAHLVADHDAEECITCHVMGSVYQRTELPRVPHSHTFSLAGWLPLPATPDPAPERAWTCTDASMLAVYGAHTHRLWPGYLTGFRAAVTDALNVHPWVRRARSDGYRGLLDVVHVSDRDGTVRVDIPVAWEVPIPRARYQGEKGRGPFLITHATSHRVELPVPDRLFAPSKAAAVEMWDGKVAEWVAKFLPPLDGKLRGCSHCRGRGWHLQPEAGTDG